MGLYTLVYSPPIPTWPFSYTYVTLHEYKAPLIFIKNYNYNQNTSRNCYGQKGNECWVGEK